MCIRWKLILLLAIGAMVHASFAQAAPKAAAPTARSALIARWDEKFLKAGLDIRIASTESEQSVLRLRYILMSRPLVYKLANETSLLAEAEAAGFSEVRFSDGAGAFWHYDVVTHRFQSRAR